MSGTVSRTYRYRVRDKHAKVLDRKARAVSFVWNFCNETQRTAVQRGDRWPSYFDLTGLCVGTSVELGISATTIEATCRKYVASRITARRRLLRWRGKRSLGWVPIRRQGLRAIDGGFSFHRQDFDCWVDRPLPAGAEITEGSSFSTDARGRWYLNVQIDAPRPPAAIGGPSVGIDLGLKSVVTLSDGTAVAAPQHYRKSAARLGLAQRARKHGLARTVHAKIGNQRRDFLQKLSTKIVREHGAVYVGNVSSSRLAKTSFAKSVLDAGWSSLRKMLSYKSDYAGIVYREVNENGSTVTCSDCGLVGGPGGRKGLVIREWTCSGCGTVHDRDVNAATNILRWGCPAPTGAESLNERRRHH